MNNLARVMWLSMVSVMIPLACAELEAATLNSGPEIGLVLNAEESDYETISD